MALKKKEMMIVKSILLGIAITLATGLVNNTPAELVGAMWYGYILPWLVRPVVAPQYATVSILWTNLIIDVIFWSLVAFVVCKLACKPLARVTKKRER